MTNPIFQYKAALVACGLVLPSSAVFLSGLLGAGVFELQASTVGTEVHLPSVPDADLTRVVEGWNINNQTRSPFWVEPRSDEPNPTNISEQFSPDTIDPATKIISADRYMVTSVMPNARTPLAVIDGRPRRLGDVLDGGWRIERINAVDHTVSLVHPSGARARIGLKNIP